MTNKKRKRAGVRARFASVVPQQQNHRRERKKQCVAKAKEKDQTEGGIRKKAITRCALQQNTERKREQ